MESRSIANGILRAIAIVVGIALLGYVIFQLASVIVYIIIASVLSLIARPFVIFLRRKLRIKRLLAVVVTMALMLTVLLGLIGLFVPLIIDQGISVSTLDIDQLEERVIIRYTRLLDYLHLQNLSIDQSFLNFEHLGNIAYGFLPGLIESVASWLATISIGIFSVLFICFFLLKDSGTLQSTFLTLFPDVVVPRIRRSINKAKTLLSRYFIGLILQLSILFTIYTVVLLIVGIKNAIVIAFLCAIINIIPYLGPLISGFLMLALTVTSNIGYDFSDIILPKTIYVMIGFIIGQLVDNVFSQPYIYSKSVKSHPLEIFLIIIIAGLLFGIVGMIIAVPLYTTIKVILKEFFYNYKLVKKLTRGL